MKIPKYIRIGDTEYKIKKKIIIDWNESIAGQINYWKKELLIKEYGDNKIDESNFFHGIAHGIMKEMEYNHPKVVDLRNNENFIQELGLVLRKTFKDLMEKQK